MSSPANAVVNGKIRDPPFCCDIVGIVAGEEEREVQKIYWIEHSKELTVEAMMLDSHASELDKIERPEVLSLLPPFEGKSVLELGAGIGRFTGELAKEAGHVLALDFIESVIEKVSWAIIFHQEYVETTKEFVAKLDLKPGQKVLDVGCGIGGGDFYMAENFDVEVVGIDLSINMVSFALERAIGRKCSVEFEVADCTKKTYPDNTFDVIYSRDTILHIQVFNTGNIEMQEDYDEIVSGWKAKLKRSSTGEQRWGLFIAKKN
ncbi:hypothetical protein GW17_00018861 [Ensete ventricosum]|nr:hypothetical protein GW17_00018861 [Ensete ventricosum]